MPFVPEKPHIAPAPAPPFFGWRVVGAAFTIAMFGWGFGFYGPPIFLRTVTERTGWSIPLVSSAVTLHFLVGAGVVLTLPRLYRTVGIPIVTVGGAVLLAAGILGWAVAGAKWELFLAAVASGAGWVALGAAAINAMVAPWFVRGRPAALGMAYNGASIGGVVFSPLWVALIGALGFVAAAATAGAVMIATVAALALAVLSKTPEGLGQGPDGDARGQTAGILGTRLDAGGSLWRDRRFLTLAAGMSLGLFAQIGLIAHLFSVLVPAVGAQASGFLMGLATASAIGGRTVVGWLMPPGADRRLVACSSYGVQVVGSLILLFAAGTDVPLLVLGIFLFGAGIGNATSLPPLIAQAEFVAADVARVVPLIVSIAQATYAFAPAAFGLLRNAAADTARFGLSETALLFGGAILVQASTILCLLAGRGR
jgi:hypothetical protein